MSAYQVPQDPTAVMGRRIAAWIIDVVIAVGVFVACFLALVDWVELDGVDAETFCAAHEFSSDEPRFCEESGDLVFYADGADVVLIYVIPSLYLLLVAGTLIQGAAGGTPGKLMVGLRTIRQDTGELAGVGRSFIRSLLWVVDGLPCVIPLVGIITGSVSTGHRRVGDMAASTLVVRRGSVGRPPAVPGLTEVPATYYGAPGTAAPGSWGPPPPAPPGGWVPPTTPPSAPPTSEPAPWSPRPPDMPGPPGEPPSAPAPPPAGPQPSRPGVDAPMWDEARDTYIQWDPELEAWMHWDEAAREWRRIT